MIMSLTKKLVPVLFLLTISIGFHKVQADTQHNFNIENLQKKADQGDPKAQYNLGIAYANGQGVSEDQQKAVEYFQKAANQGVLQAQTYLGAAYFLGQGGVRQNVQKSIEYYQKAANQGSFPAKKALKLLPH
jgi:uncharacterized protein